MVHDHITPERRLDQVHDPVENRWGYFFAPEALTSEGWMSGVRIKVGTSGLTRGQILSVETGAVAEAEDIRLAGPVMPGIPNLHSHATQRAIAGRTATRAVGDRDHFWSWREAMYQAALNLTPEDIEVAAAQCFMEMLRAGYTSVAEFHYLHLGRDGQPYENIAELSHRVIRAAKRVGLPITHLPVLYRWSGVHAAPPLEEQRRFILDMDQYARLHQQLNERYAQDPLVQVGYAAHSLRAVTPDDLRTLIELRSTSGGDAPLHIHIAEQTAEVEMWQAAYQARPVEWLLDHAPVDRHWTLVHATHVNEREVQRLAATEAVVGLCPSTEADLGDGIFPLLSFLESGGRYGVGSDSNVRSDPAEELRVLEWGQRLHHQARNLSYSQYVQGDVGRAGRRSLGHSLWGAAIDGGNTSVQRPTGLRAGCWADWIVLNPHEDGLIGAKGHLWADQWIFASRHATPLEVYIAGQRVIEGGKHPLQDEISSQYRERFGVRNS